MEHYCKFNDCLNIAVITAEHELIANPVRYGFVDRLTYYVSGIGGSQ